jgi:hypothetical protein
MVGHVSSALTDVARLFSGACIYTLINNVGESPFPCLCQTLFIWDFKILTVWVWNGGGKDDMPFSADLY